MSKILINFSVCYHCVMKRKNMLNCVNTNKKYKCRVMESSQKQRFVPKLCPYILEHVVTLKENEY